ncbi:MAG: AbrB family transcriptional regulator, partial [Tabrizicola sp.]
MPPLARIAAGLALGSLGGLAFYGLALPLPWMLGALFITMIAAVAGLPVLGPMRLRPAIVAVIGVLLGSRFSPAVIGQAGEALVT